MITKYAQNSPPSLVCTKLFSLSGHEILYAGEFSLQVCSFGTSRGLVVKLGSQTLSRIRAVVPHYGGIMYVFSIVMN